MRRIPTYRPALSSTSGFMRSTLHRLSCLRRQLGLMPLSGCFTRIASR